MFWPNKKGSLLNKILYNNVLIISFFLFALWLIATLFMCKGVYDSAIKQSTDILSSYTEKAQEAINHAIIQTDNIAKSSYILGTLNKKDISASELIEFLDYSKNMLSSMTDSGSSVKIFTTNEAIYESRFFSNAQNLPEYDSIMEEFIRQDSNIIFDDVFYSELPNPVIIMYHHIIWNKTNIIQYHISLPAAEGEFSDIRIVNDSDPLHSNNSYIKMPLHEHFYCLIPTPRHKIIYGYLSTLFLSLLALIFLWILTISLSRNIAKRTLSELNEFIETLDVEDLISDSKIFQTSYDLYELNIVKQKLQKLTLDIKAYSDAVKSAELENKQLELDFLAMQLDPHMLYNSLSSIRLDAFRLKSERVMKLIDTMALYYRNVLGKSRSFVTVREELETIEKYILINELSHEKNYSFETEIDNSLYSLQIPPQFLHTFVENCIIHGLSGIRENCMIKITITEKNGVITIEIYDNGYGIPAEKLELLNAGISTGKHVGIRNSLKRLKLVYGEKSSIRFESVKNEYTKVIITFVRP